MKTIQTSLVAIFLFYYCNNVQAQGGCWVYTVQKSWETQDALCCGVGGTYPVSSQGYATKDQCEAAAQKAKVPNVPANNIYKYVKTEVSGCKCGSSNTKPSQKNNDVGNSIERKTVDKELTKWYLDKINPINSENILKLLSFFPKNEFLAAALETTGTVLGPILFAKGYLDVTQTAMQQSLDKAMDVLNIPIEDQNKFLLATSSFINNYDNSSIPEFSSFINSKTPVSTNSKYSVLAYNDNATWAENAAILATTYFDSKSASQTDYYITSAAFVLSSYFAARNGDKSMSASLLTNAVNTLGKAVFSPKNDLLKESINQINSSYNLNVAVNSIPNNATNTSATNNLTRLNGSYENYYLYDSYRGEINIENNKFTDSYGSETQILSFIVSMQGNTIEIKSTGKVTSSNSTTTSSSTCLGQINNNEASLTGTTQGETIVNGTTYPFSSKFFGELTILANGDIQIKYTMADSKYTGIAKYRKIN